MMTQLNIADPKPNPDMQMPAHKPFLLGRCKQQFLSGGKYPIPIENPYEKPQKITKPTKVFINDAINTQPLTATIDPIHNFLFDIFDRNNVDIATPTLIVIIVKVNRTDNAVFEVSSPCQYKYEEMYGVKVPKVQIEPKTIKVNVLEHKARIAYFFNAMIKNAEKGQ